MYGILAACIAAMAMFLGLFALSVSQDSNELTQASLSKAAIETVHMPAEKVAAQ